MTRDHCCGMCKHYRDAPKAPRNNGERVESRDCDKFHVDGYLGGLIVSYYTDVPCTNFTPKRVLKHDDCERRDTE